MYPTSSYSNRTAYNRSLYIITLYIIPLLIISSKEGPLIPPTPPPPPPPPSPVPTHTEHYTHSVPQSYREERDSFLPYKCTINAVHPYHIIKKRDPLLPLPPSPVPPRSAEHHSVLAEQIERARIINRPRLFETYRHRRSGNTFWCIIVSLRRDNIEISSERRKTSLEGLRHEVHTYREDGLPKLSSRLAKAITGWAWIAWWVAPPCGQAGN